ncbi:uncharacterized protein DS421_13g412970 [Arachis hypogaea]|nr:uncharacterized protein DS421_13g412970 [Arachis hypogaea]
MEDKLSYRKGSGVVKQTKGKSTKATKETVLEEEEEESIPPPSTTGTSSSHKYLINGIVNDVLQEFVNLTKQMINSSKQARILALQNETFFRKFQSRVEVLMKYLDSLDDDQPLTNQDEDMIGTEDEGSDT